MPLVPIGDSELYYEEQGAGDPIVFSHGLLWSGRMYAAQMAALSDKWRCIAYDHRGQGRSATSPSPYGMDTLADDAARLIDKLKAGPCHFVGLSMGGFVGLRLALRRPELLRSLTLIDTAADREPRLNVPKYAAMEWAARKVGMKYLVPSVMKIMFGGAFLRDRARAGLRSEQAAQLAALEPVRMKAALESVTQRHAVQSSLGAIKTPSLVLHGEDDRAIKLARATKMALAIPGAQLVVIARAGHTSTVEEPEAISRELRRFVEVH